MALEYEDDFERYSDDFDELEDEEEAAPRAAEAPRPRLDPAKLALLQELPLAMGEPCVLYQQRPMSQQEKYIEGICREQTVSAGFSTASRGTSTYMQPPTADEGCQVPAFTSKLDPRESAEYFSGLFAAVFDGEGEPAAQRQVEGGPAAASAEVEAQKASGKKPAASRQKGSEKRSGAAQAHSVRTVEVGRLAASWCKENVSLLLSEGSADTELTVTPLGAVRCKRSFFVSLGVELGRDEVLPSEDHPAGKPFYSAVESASDPSSLENVYPVARSRRKQRLCGFFDSRGDCLALYPNDLQITCSAEQPSFTRGTFIGETRAYVACGTECGILLLLSEPPAADEAGSSATPGPAAAGSLITAFQAFSALPRRTVSEVISVAPASQDGLQFVTLHRAGELLLWHVGQAGSRTLASPLMEAARNSPFARAPEKVYHAMLGRPALSAGVCVLRDGSVILVRDWQRLADFFAAERAGPEGGTGAPASAAAPAPGSGDGRDVAVCPFSCGAGAPRVATATAVDGDDVVATGYALVIYDTGLVYAYSSMSGYPAFTAMVSGGLVDILTGKAPEGVVKRLKELE